MRGVRGLEFVVIPVIIFSLTIRPLVNAALYLLTKNSYSVSINHLVGESCRYHCEHKSDDWNGHRGEVLMIQNSHIILVTKQRHINSLLDDRMVVWTLTFPAIPGLLLAKWGQCPLSRGEIEAGPNRIDEIHISQ
jgi:hypothetical protein